MRVLETTLSPIVTASPGGRLASAHCSHFPLLWIIGLHSLRDGGTASGIWFPWADLASPPRPGNGARDRGKVVGALRGRPTLATRTTWNTMKRTRALSLLALAALASLTAATAGNTYDPQNPVAPDCGAGWAGIGQYPGTLTPMIASDGSVWEPPAGVTYAPGSGWTTGGGAWRLLGRNPELQVMIDWGDFSAVQEVRQSVIPPMGICTRHRYSAAGTYDARITVLQDGVEIGSIGMPVVALDLAQGGAR